MSLMPYQEALRLWGADRLAQWDWLDIVDIDPDSVTVETHFNAGYACCGGRDEGCYCSFAESPSAYVSVRGRLVRDVDCGGYTMRRGQEVEAAIDLEDFDFTTFLAELVEVGGGVGA